MILLESGTLYTCANKALLSLSPYLTTFPLVPNDPTMWLKPLETKFIFGNGTMFVLISFMSKFKLPGNLDPLQNGFA